MPDNQQSWTEFRMDSFGDPYLVWHDGPDFATLTARWRANQGEVHTALLAGLDEHDPLAAKAFGSLPLTLEDRRSVVGQLVPYLGSQPPAFHLAVAQAIFALSGEQAVSSEIVKVLLGAGFWSDRLDAAIALREFAPTQHLIDALTEGVKDPDYLVRYHSSNTLLQFAGRDPEISHDSALFELVRSDTRPAQWASAASTLGDIAHELINR